ncbi:MAG: leucine-rich repeat protein [Firmicutes bacterium]|nr:leucine-rich repeat protein [Bacillota bacterium]
MGLIQNVRKQLFNIMDDLKAHPTYKKDGKNISLNDLGKEMGFKVPARYAEVADEPMNMVFRPDGVKKDDICVVVRPAEITNIPGYTCKDQYELAMEKGALTVVLPQEMGEAAGLNEKDHSVILVKNGMTKISRFIRSLRRRQKGRVVMITGSIGKTTTKDFCYNVSKDHFSTYRNVNNTNTVFRVIKHLFDERNHPYDVFIHEIGAGFRGSLRYINKYYRPDIFIVTNVLKHHLSIYKTFEKLFDDKVCADEFMPDNGIVIVNYDDENLRNHKFIHQVISFGIEQEDVDYRGINIQQNDNTLSFDVLERKTGKTTHIEIDIFGEHNVYNALAAYALGMVLGVTGEDVAKSLLEYKTKGIRQMMVNIGGVNIDMDCYNVAEESIMSMLRVGEKFELEGDAEKIAIIGGENKVGPDVRERSLAFGETLSDIQFDKFLFCGREGDDDETLNIYGDAKDIMKTFSLKNPAPCEYCTSIDAAAEYLKKNVRRGDLVMLKGIFLLDMPISVDKAFGTSFSFSQTNNIEKMITKWKGQYKFKTFEGLDEAEIVWAQANEEGVMKIPAKLGKTPVFRIGARAFRTFKSIKSVAFENGVKNIGEAAFARCPFIEELDIPSSVMVIETNAFAKCTSLKKVRLEEGVTHLGEGAFRGCTALEEIYIPESIGMIEDDVFEGDSEVTIYCPKGSFAMEYAIDNGINFSVV